MQTFHRARRKFMLRFREAISHREALPQLSALAIIIGILTGLLIVGFRVVLETPAWVLPISSAERFEELSPSARVVLILGGGIVITLILRLLSATQRQMSVSHVIDRLHNHQGRLPFVNAAAQFGLCSLAICCGHSVGREGAAIHAGAGAASRLGSWLRLPNNSMATMIACGVAAGISASFDTPLAGVIFAMEVILMEYTIVGFVPVILSSVIAAAISKTVLGDTVVFSVADASQIDLAELGIVTATGILIGTLSFTYIRLNTWALSFSHLPIEFRIFLAASATAIAAFFVPEIMGLGYDTIQDTIEGKLLIGSVIIIALTKLAITPTAVGLGIPGGLIGPSLFIGACVGFACAALTDQIFPGLEIDIQTYVLLGMAGMFAASINAPLAGLVAILELSRNPNIIFPAMLLICVACLTTRQLFGVKGLFYEQLKQRGQALMFGATENALKKISVLSQMSQRFVEVQPSLSFSEASEILADKPRWIVFRQDNDLIGLKATDLARFLESEEHEQIQLVDIPARRFYLQPIKDSDTVFDAWLALEKSQKQHLYVTSHYAENTNILGILSGDRVRECYQPKAVKTA